MADVRMHANRTFRPRVLSSGVRRGVDGYYAFTHGVRPSWWTDVQTIPGATVLGVLEVDPGRADGAIVVTSGGLTVLDPDENRYLRYADIDTIEQLQKYPVPDTLKLVTRSGSVFDLRVGGHPGTVVEMMRFLIAVLRDLRASSTSKKPQP